tara:strand:+ start:2562 stop:2753 length:192 start_codon:yes stop_codon:yes gene_type:complete
MVGYFDEDKLTIKELSSLLRVSQRTIREWIRVGMPAVKVNGRWFSTKESVKGFLDQKNEGASK